MNFRVAALVILSLSLITCGKEPLINAYDIVCSDNQTKQIDLFLVSVYVLDRQDTSSSMTLTYQPIYSEVVKSVVVDTIKNRCVMNISQ